MYKIIKTLYGQSILKTNDDGSFMSIPFDTSNTDYQEYLAWVDTGNTPEIVEL